MKRIIVLTISILSVCALLVLSLDVSIAQGGINFTFEHQDPAGDVQKFNRTLNGTFSDDFEGLDIKHLDSERTGDDLVIIIDLKSKETFRIEEGTKYVVRILTSPDNTTGYNLTYRNGTLVLNSFEKGVNGTAEEISGHVDFDNNKEIMEIKVPIKTYLDNITHFGLDAYSMKVTKNATYLDYISELPGHPEYINPEVKEEEGLDDDDSDDEDDGGILVFVVLGVIGLIVLVIIVIVIVVLLLKKGKTREEPEEGKKKAGSRPKPPPPPPED